jgi:hypothetical protein
MRETGELAVLTTTEIERFYAFGWVVVRGLLDLSESSQLRDEIEGALRDAYGSAYGKNTRGDLDDESPEANVVPLMSKHVPLSMSLVADDTRLWTIAEQLLGPVTLACPALGECLIGDTPWHRDPGIGEPWVRFRTYCEPCRAESGALRFIPGSQHPYFGRHLERYRATAQATGAADLDVDLPWVAVDTDPGDMIAFDPRTLHSSTGGTHRLAWNVDYAALPDTADHEHRKRTRELVLELSSWPHPARWPTWDEWTSTRPRTPARDQAIGRLLAIGAIEDTT